MADLTLATSAVPETGLSGNVVRGVAESATEAAKIPSVAESAANLEATVRLATEEIIRGLDLAGKALGQTVSLVSDKAFESAAKISPTGTPSSLASSGLGQPAFNWSGYIQAIGILCILLAALWLLVWLVRRYGKFNFLPRPGGLPRDALIMEAQLPLGPRKGLMVVRFLNKRLLLGVTEHQITLLSEEKAANVQREQNSGQSMPRVSESFGQIFEEAERLNPMGVRPTVPPA